MTAKSYIVTLLTLLVTACSTSIAPTYTSTGNPGYRLVCGGFFGDGDMGSCYEKAGETCQSQGYKIIQTSVSSLIIECRTESHIEDSNR